MDHKGRAEMFFQFDQNRRPLFTHPGRVTTNTQNTIAVIDWLGADGQGRVVIVNQIGQLVNVYTSPYQNFVVVIYCMNSCRLHLCYVVQRITDKHRRMAY
jgi:hypothetical protein